MQRKLRAQRLIAAAIAVAATGFIASAPAQATTTGAAPTAHRAATTQAAPSNYYLYIYGQAQQKSNWCWAATGNSVADYFGYDYTQNQFCDMAFGLSTSTTCPNDQATLGNDQRAFSTIGINPGRYISGVISYSTLVGQISNNEPVMTRIGWTSGGGHMMVLTGYDTTNNQVQYYNPWPSDPRFNVSTYDWYRSNPQFTWTHTLYGIGA